MSRIFKIDPLDADKEWNKFSDAVLKVVEKEMKKFGYVVWIKEYALGIEGNGIWFKHPQRVGAINLNIGSEFEKDKSITDADAWRVYQYDVTVNLNNGIHKSGHPYANIDEDIGSWNVTYNWKSLAHAMIENNEFEMPKLKIDKLVEFMNDVIPGFENEVFDEFDAGYIGDSAVESGHGPLGTPNAHFSTWEDYRGWLEYVGVEDIDDWAEKREIYSLIPELKELFVF